MAPRDTDVISNISSTEAPVVPSKEAPEVLVRFEDLELAEADTEQDSDYSPSEVDTEDSLEYSSETERTVLEDALVEGKVGIDYTTAAVTMATEYLASYRAVQVGLAAGEAAMGLVGTALPIPAIANLRRSARAARRAGAKHIEVVRSEPSIVATLVNYALSLVGLEVVSVCEGAPKRHLEAGTMPFTPCVEFGAMDLSDYDSDQDADYSPSEEEDSEDSIEYDSEADVSEVSEVSEASEAEDCVEEVEDCVKEVERTAVVVEA